MILRSLGIFWLDIIWCAENGWVQHLGQLEFSDTSIYDEIYGYIPVTKVELEIVNHPLFQRLNHIKQLGTAYRVFPGAQHTRFSHSLGVMHIMDKMINSTNLKDKITPEDKQKLRVAALLHDIGHYPLSHVVETVITEHNRRKDRKHEKLGEYIVKKSGVANILKNYGIEPDEVAQIFTGESPEPLFNQLMSSNLDADRIDYLLRDSVHTGVAYGRFDLNRLIHTLSLDNSGQLCVEKSGIHAVEGYVIGRYLMWAVVYTHRVINAFNELAEHICEKCIGSTFYSYDAIQKLVREDESKFAKFNDHYIYERIYHAKPEDKYVDELSRMFLERKVLAVAKEAQELTEEGTGSREYFLLDEFKKETKIADLVEKSGITKEWIFHNSSRTQLPGLRPLLEWPVEEEEVEQAQREMSKAIRIADENGKSTPLVQIRRTIVYYLKNMSLDKVRIYTKGEYREQLEKVLDQELAEQ